MVTNLLGATFTIKGLYARQSAADGGFDSHARITPALQAAPGSPSVHIAKGITLKLASLLLFALMSALIRGFGDTIPVGQVVFFRSVFATLRVGVLQH